MSSVRKKDQSPHKFTVLDAALNVYDHTTTVISNPNIFKPKYQFLIDRLDNYASMIYHCCRSANEDYDNRIKEEAEVRIELQSEAIKYCMKLKTDIRLAQRKYHLRTSKVSYWNKITNLAMESIKSWRTSEIRTYKENYGL